LHKERIFGMMIITINTSGVALKDGAYYLVSYPSAVNLMREGEVYHIFKLFYIFKGDSKQSEYLSI
jgi:hypothetical protein